MKVITDAIVATKTHDNAVILDRFAREEDWDAFISDRDDLDGKGQIAYLYKGTRFYVDAYYKDGTALIHIEGSPSPLWISTLDLNLPATQQLKTNQWRPFMYPSNDDYDLDEATIAALEAIAARKGRSLDEVVAEALDQFILREKAKAKPPTSEEFEVACSLWRMEFAFHTFQAVRAGIEKLLERKLHSDEPEYYPLCVGIICLYARPFTNNRPVGPLSEDIVPKEHLGLHQDIIRMW
jgi:hypothetical protein